MSASKGVIVVDPALSIGLLANAVAYLALTLGQRLPSLLGPDVVDGSGLVHAGTSELPLPILRASPAQLAAIHSTAQEQPELLVVSFTDAAQTTLTYAAYTTAIAARPMVELVYLGVALYGPPRRINALTGSLPLLRQQREHTYCQAAIGVTYDAYGRLSCSWAAAMLSIVSPTRFTRRYRPA